MSDQPTSSKQRQSTANPSTLRIIAIAVVIGTMIAIALELTSGVSGPLLQANFGAHGLVANEYAYEHPTSPQAVTSTLWEVTSGSLFALDGTGWTGVPDGQAPGPQSAAATDSAVFRLHTVRSDFNNVAVSFKLKINRFVSTSRTPPQAYDGVHIWLRYQTHDWLYFTSVARRDGQVVIGKKLPIGSSTQGGGAPAAGGVYFHQVYRSGHSFPLGQWHTVEATVKTVGQTAIVRVFIDGHQIARLTDTRGAILRPGAVGIRGDNVDFQFKDFQVTAL